MPDDARAPTAAVEVLDLYDTPPAVADDMPPESTFTAPGGVNGPPTTMLRNVGHPTLTVFRPAAANGVGVIVAPGGGWRILAWEHEGVQVAQWLAARGYTAFLLKYRLQATPADPEEFARGRAPPAENPYDRMRNAELPREIASLIPGRRALAARVAAEEDGRAALALIRARAADWGVDPARIGMIGFSAGAFLTVAVALEPGGPPLAFAAPIYGGETRGAAVPADAPALFTVIAADDRMLVRVVEGLYADWIAADRPAEIHVFARGGHGFGVTPQGAPVDKWLDLFGDWLEELKLARG